MSDKREAEQDYEIRRQESAKRQKVYADAKKDLGDAFGTKKAQKLQRSRESNLVSTNGIGSVMSTLMEDINAGSALVPGKEEVIAKQEEMRPIPPHDKQTDVLALAYPLEGVIQRNEMDALKQYCESFKKIEDDKNRLQALACSQSRYINHRMRRVFDEAETDPKRKVDTKRLRIIYYASVLLGIFLNRRLVGTREKLSEKLRNPPGALLDSLILRFAPAGRIDSRGNSRILTHLFVLALHLDGFSCEIKELQEDLGMRPPEVVTLWRELGCQIQPLSDAERQRKKLSRAEAKHHRRAVLRTPLVFPQIKRGGPPR
ncbi:DNA-directed RNA polymerase I subunit rpa49 [Savitreella phatthalungensis]